MSAFATGSRVYGTPTEASDVDLCVVLSEADLALLRELCDGDPGSGGDSLRFGKLNLICFTLEESAEPWRVATERLAARKPVTRDEAVKEIKAEAKARRKERNDHRLADLATACSPSDDQEAIGAVGIEG
jgi:hypothetical protein